MVRLLITILFELLANAVGLIVAAWVLPGFTLSVTAFVIVVAIFTVVKFVLAPLILKLSLQYVRALTGAVALVTTFAGLWITSLLSAGLTIDGYWTWILATLIVWLAGLLASLIIPLFLFKQVMSDVRSNRSNNNIPLPPTL